MKINIVFNKDIDGWEEKLGVLENTLKTCCAEFKSFDILNMRDFGDFTFVTGGDGTILRAADFYAERGIPILGINTGRLGFLSHTGMDNIEDVVRSVMNGNYTVEDRIMLKADENSALNDFVLKGCTPLRTSKFRLSINGEFVCSCIADGLIISTPTGSTAYNLSAGGPILHPALNAFAIVPICPHSLNIRPLVIPSGETAAVTAEDKLISVYADGIHLKNTEKIEIKIAGYSARLAFVNNGSFYSLVQNKLHWGVSPEINSK